MTVGATAAARPPLATGLLAAATGGAIGAVARWVVTIAWPQPHHGFPWTTFAINVIGCALLAALPLLPAAHRVPWLPVFLGTGVLGGFTTMSAASVETFSLLDHGRVALGAAYCLGTLAAAIAAVLLVDLATTDEQRLDFEVHEGDE